MFCCWGQTDIWQLPSPFPHRLRKNLKSLIIVHPSWFIRTLLALTKPFIRSEVNKGATPGRVTRFWPSFVFPQLQIQSENQVCLQLGRPCRAGPDGVRVHTRLHQTVSVRFNTISDQPRKTKSLQSWLLYTFDSISDINWWTVAWPASDLWDDFGCVFFFS